LGSVSIPQTSSPREEHGILVNSYYEAMLEYSIDGYARNYLSSSIVNRFIDGIQFEYDDEFPSQSKVFFKEETLKEVEVLKKFTYTSQILSSRLKVAEVRGKEIVNQIFTSLISKEKVGFELLPSDYRFLYDLANTEENKTRIICDFVAGMTDRYAIEFYGRLKSEDPATIFKPL
jgi:dGTPase